MKPFGASCFSQRESHVLTLAFKALPSIVPHCLYHLLPCCSAPCLSFLSSHNGLLAVPQTLQACSYLRAFAVPVPSVWDLFSQISTWLNPLPASSLALRENAPDLTLQPPPSRCPICFLYPLSPSNIAPILFIVYSPPSYPSGFPLHQGSSLSVCSLICLKGPGQCLIHSRCETTEGLQGLRRPHSSCMCLARDKGSPGLTQLRSVPQAQPVTADRSSEDPSQDSFSTHHLAARRLTCLS